MLLACSHLVVAAKSVSRLAKFFSEAFSWPAYFENEMFVEFVLPSKFRIAFFKPVGTAARFFREEGDRDHCAFGLTVENVDALYAKLAPELARWGASVSGPPKTHPWGEKSFLLIDPEGNRWEVAESPTKDGMLNNREA